VEETVDAGVVYASAWFEPAHPIEDDWVVAATFPALPHTPKMAIFVRSPDGRILCSAATYGKAKPPTDHDGLVDWLETRCAPSTRATVRG
jgi:hypothetical protein